MVEDRVADGTRIAQLLSSELDGRDDGVLAAVAVVDADPDVAPDPEGSLAYRVAWRGTRLAAVEVTPDAALLRVDRDSPPDRARDEVHVDDIDESDVDGTDDPDDEGTHDPDDEGTLDPDADGTDLGGTDELDVDGPGELDVGGFVERARAAGLPCGVDDGAATVRIESGAAVKRALDALVAGLD